jgi:hypothetical protein
MSIYLFILTHNMYSNPHPFSECELLYYVYSMSIHLFPLASPYPPRAGDVTSSYSIPRGCERATGVCRFKGSASCNTEQNTNGRYILDYNLMHFIDQGGTIN